MERKLAQSKFQQIVQMQNPIASIHDVITIFVHGRYLQKPYETITDAQFHSEIHKNLHEMKFRSIFRTQAHAWPAVLEGRAVFIINSEKSGKTFSYLPALLSNILYEEENVATKAQGPIGVIVVRSSRDIEKIYKYCRKMVSREQMEIITAFGKWNCENKKVSLLNGCDLLITTPPCFSRLAQGDVIRMFDKKRIKFLVLDGLDEMCESFESEMKDIIKTCTKGCEHPELNPQLIVTSSSWMDYFRGYMALTCDPVMIFGRFIEAALFAKCRFTIFKKSHEEKLSELWQQLKTREYTTVKTLIVLNNRAELIAVSNYLRDRAIGFKCFNAVDEFSYSEKLIITDWIKEVVEQMTILLVTDEALNRLDLRCVQYLIHFSLPDTMTMFSQRFATMLDRFSQAIEGKAKGSLKTFIMLDEDNTIEIPRLVDFLKTRRVLNNEIPEAVNNLFTHLIEEREMYKRDPMYEQIMPICSSIYLYGACPKMSNCKSRHAFTGSDKPINIPCDGLVKFELVATRSPAHYYIKILEHQLANETEWISCEKKIKKIEKSLTALQGLMNEKAMIQVGVKTDDICAVFVPKLLEWCRCKVLEKESTEKSVFRAIVYLMDFGEKMIVKATDLKALPNEFKTMDPLLTELRIVDLVPYDLDSNFDTETTSEVKKIFTMKSKSEETKVLKVEFAVQNIIFAKTFEIRHLIKDLNLNVTKLSLRKELLDKNFCLKDSTVTEKLKILLKRANIYIPPTSAPVCDEITVIEEKEGLEEAQPRWKFLTIGSVYNVLLREFISPDLFYTRLDDSENKVLPKLMQIVNDCGERAPLSEIKKDEYCLVAKSKKKARRGLIVKVKHSYLKVFLLDEGETIRCKKTDVYQLPASIINVLPFQAIKCRLIGIKPTLGLNEWNSQSSNAFRNFINEVCFEKIVKLRVIARQNNCYDVSLFHPVNGKSLHTIAIQKNLADKSENIQMSTDKEGEICETNFDSSDNELTVSIDEKTAQNNLMKLLNSEEAKSVETSELLVMLGFPKTARLLPPIDQVPAVEAAKTKEQPIVEETPDEKLTKETLNHSSYDSKTPLQGHGLPSQLSYIHKHPKIKWRQDDFMVLLNIVATDCVDYSLEASDSSFKICIKYEGNAYEYTNVQLYGCIEPKLLSHEKSGGEIIVRLVKSLVMKWPRLTKLNEPNRFITFSHDPLPSYLTGKKECGQSVHNARPGGESSEEDLNLGDLSSDSDA